MTSTYTPPYQVVSLELSVDEAEALRAWLLKPTSDGGAAIEDNLVKPAMVKLGGALDRIAAIATVRSELEDAGFDTGPIADERILELGRRISETSVHRLT